jgi:hypothetical protein
MGAEDTFAEKLAKRLRPLVPAKYVVETKRSLLYAVSFGDDGTLQLGQNREGEPTRGGGTGFEQDLLVFERVTSGDTAVVPRVSVELKFGGISTHDGIVYSEKARRIRQIYPYVRYGLILGGIDTIPGRTLRLGTEFDFIVAVPARIQSASLTRLAKLLRSEIRLSRRLTSVLKGTRKIGLQHRALRHARSI